jgi:formate-nitrite transporter family protein
VRSEFGLTLVHAIFAGWLIALMVWLLPAAEANRVQVIVIVTYGVALGSFAHVIAGATGKRSNTVSHLRGLAARPA